jgi:hypothetical protein
MKCRTCKSEKLFKFLDLGNHPPSDQFRKKDQLSDPVVFYPLDVYICEDCGFVQLGYVVPPEILYQDNYPYESSTTETGKRHYHDFAASVVRKFKFNETDLAVDIGSNVGVLMEGFKLLGLKINGVDPAPNICVIAEERGIPTINDFFGKNAAEKIVAAKGKASVITGTNVFAHVDDLDAFMDAIKILIDDKKGVFIIEAPHLLHLIKNLEYDTIYHEHLSYISISPLVPFFGKFGMEIINVEQKDIHGGSIRIFVSNKGNYEAEESVEYIIKLEHDERLDNKDKLIDFAHMVAENKAATNQLIHKLKSENKRIVAVSAPAKGMTFLNYCKLDRQTLDYVTEKSKLKIGLYTPGDNIPVVPDSQLLEDMPDYALLLAWNFADEIIRNNQEYRNRGGKFIIPIPSPRIV